jgi:hypothetical protein
VTVYLLILIILLSQYRGIAKPVKKRLQNHVIFTKWQPERLPVSFTGKVVIDPSFLHAVSAC